MQKSLLNYRFILALFFLLLVIALHTLAAPTPTCPIVTERFQGLPDGTTANNSSNGWTINASNVLPSGYFAVKSNRFHAQELGGQGIWSSKVFSVAGYSDFQVAVKVTSEGDMNSTEYVRVYYKINGGAETLYDSRTGNFGTIDFISPTLTGNNVQIIVKIYNYNNGGSQTSKYYIEEYRVFKEHGPCGPSIPVSITAGNGGVLTCSNPSLTINASTTATGTTTWSWTGPNSFTSTSQNPVVTTGGTYTVTATNAAGTGSASVTISENKTPPVVTATGGNLACTSSIVIGATSSVSGSTFSWTGPNGFTSTAQNPTVSAAGSYTVVVTNPANGCTASQTVSVTGGSASPVSIWSEAFTLANNTTSSGTWSSAAPGGIFSVQNNEFRVTNNGLSGEGVWTSGSFSITGKTTINFSATVRSGVSSGGTLENNGSSLDFVRFYYKLNGGAETLISEYLGAINSNSATNTNLSSAIPNGSTLEIVIRARATASDEFYYFDNFSLTGINSTAGITATVNGAVTCTNFPQLFATVTGGTATAYSWTGPNGFTSSLQNPVTTGPGQYTVTATLTSGGCTQTVSAPVTVTENKTKPDVTTSSTTGSNEITCLVGGLTLTGNSSVPGATYSWTLPNGVTGAGSVTSATLEGDYIFRATNPANGCFAFDTFTVVRNMATPMDASIAGGDQVLTCIKTSATMIASNNLAGVTFNWIGPNGFTAAGPSATITQPGYYNVIMTHPVTGCNHSIGAAVLSNVAPPANLAITITSANQEITCTNSSLQLTGSSSTAGVTYHWSGPSGFNSTAAVANLTEAGEYILEATNPANGCMSAIARVVSENKTSPANVTATALTNSGKLTCTVTSIELQGASSTTGAQYVWTAPGFSATGANITVNAAANYILTVTDPVNGCIASATAGVTINNTPPAGVSATFSDILTCINTTIDLTGTSSTPGVNYQWSGPGGFNASTRITQTTQPGQYQLRVTDPSNGCVRTVFTTVEQDIARPADVTASNTGPITCTTPSVLLIGSSSAMDVDYLWVGPGGFISFLPETMVSDPGEYTLIVTDLTTNGCSDTVSTVVNLECGTSDRSSRNTAILLPNASDEKSSKLFQHKAYPNPFRDAVIVSFQSPVNDFVKVELYNANGALQSVLFKDHVIAGKEYRLGMNGQSLSPGIYYYLISTAGRKVYSGKLMLVR